MKDDIAFEVDGLNTRANSLRNKDPEEGFRLAEKALQLAEQAGYAEGQRRAYHIMATICFHRCQYDLSLEYYSKALQIVEQQEESTTGEEGIQTLNFKAEVIAGMGGLYSEKGDYVKALEYLFEASNIYAKTGDEKGSAIEFGNIGGIYALQGDYTNALDYKLKSLDFFEKSDDKEEFASVLANIGVIYDDQQEFEKAREYYFKSLQIDEALGNIYGMSLTMANIGDTYCQQKEPVKAMEYLQRALPLSQKTQHKHCEGAILINMGIALNLQEGHEQALDYFFMALKIAEEIKHKELTASASRNIGAALSARGKYEAAEDYLTRALALAEEIGLLRLIMKVRQNLSEVFEKKGDYKSAMECFKKAADLKEALLNQKITHAITSREMDGEFAKKEAAAALEQAQREAALSLQISETETKVLRSQMNPHFIFNALQSIQTFLLSRKPDEANTYLLKFAKLVRLVLENSQHSEVPLAEDIEALELYMQLESLRLKFPFTYQFHVAETLDKENTHIPPLILQPFVENAIWHGLQHKTEPGHIDIHIGMRNDMLYASVEDNGLGRSLNQKTGQMAAATFGIKKESLGVKLTEERLKVLNKLQGAKADFKITDLLEGENKPAGTKVELWLPLKT